MISLRAKKEKTQNMDPELQLIPTISTKGCGCGGHGHEEKHDGCGCGGHAHHESAESSKDSGCGCGGHGHAEPASESGCHSHSNSTAHEAHSCGCRGIRTPRRLHALLGGLLTLFLFLHLGIASLGSVPSRYNAAAAGLRQLSERFPIVEIVLLGLIVAQTLIGVRLLIRSGLSYRSKRCKSDGVVRYFIQRLSAVILLAFIVGHLAMFKVWPSVLTFTAVSHRFTLGGNPILIGFYAVALAGIAFHAGNGLWTGASVWGIREKAPAFWLSLALASGLVLGIFGFIGLRAFAT